MVAFQLCVNIECETSGYFVCGGDLSGVSRMSSIVSLLYSSAMCSLYTYSERLASGSFNIINCAKRIVLSSQSPPL